MMYSTVVPECDIIDFFETANGRAAVVVVVVVIVVVVNKVSYVFDQIQCEELRTSLAKLQIEHFRAFILFVT